MFRRSILVGLAVAMGLGLLGCDRSDSSDSGSSSGSGSGGTGSGQVSGVQKEAQNAVMAEVQKHWAKGPDGWTTAFTTGVSMAPFHYLGQLRAITPDAVQVMEVSEAEKMNGVEWNGQVSFKTVPYREVGDAGIAFEGLGRADIQRRPGQWTQWVDNQPEDVHVWKAKGTWKVDDDTFLLRNNKALPTPADFAKAGVK